MLVLLILTGLPGLHAGAQHLEAGVYIGATNYLGDLAESVSLQEVHPAYGFYARWNPHPKIGIRPGILMGQLSGDDQNNPRLAERAFRFEGNYFSINLHLEILPFARRALINPIEFKPGIQPFFQIGIGYTQMDANLDFSDAPLNLLNYPVPEPQDRSTFLNTSYGAGLRLDLWEYWSISLSGNWWYVYSDYLDSVSLNGRPDRNDWYLTAGISISHHFGGRTLCPSF